MIVVIAVFLSSGAQPYDGSDTATAGAKGTPQPMLESDETDGRSQINLLRRTKISTHYASVPAIESTGAVRIKGWRSWQRAQVGSN
ncbi:hypothetical protein HPT27_09825 [Permianibacter sp. IMCC34836]|uniref:hypothetical protein n=1 Tax=Permianibacter fluminis TaxID=2738515 RepID=UPI0015539223|nr:hypothetical protein [Permianibacter fluminis]NQD37326.1 hypothetical protein [Permianibacter fluminis]